MNIFDELDNILREKLEFFGFKTPTITQEKAIPRILKGYNILIAAPTGCISNIKQYTSLEEGES
ncbi:MAG: hypothetical protein QW739_00515 [Candidatus Odinarchaeota archaeon]